MTERDIDTLAAELRAYNQAYRQGQPMIPDGEYDALVEQLRALAPDHPFLTAVEPEVFPEKAKIAHPVPMLSLEKAYSQRDVSLFMARVAKAAAPLGITDLTFRVTAKLDGVAGRDENGQLVTRGDGRSGFDISGVFDSGVVAVFGRGRGLGEIVMVKSYFDDHLADEFEHPRNLVVGIVGADQINERAQAALDAGAVHFVAYAGLPGWTGDGEALVSGIDAIFDDLTADLDYPVDGIVAEVTDPALREAMGATAHHYRWQIAYKRRGESAETRVADVSWQVGRTGNLTPVLGVEPVRLSGATIRRVTAHNAGMLKNLSVGPGARIEIIRSGEVIPKLESVLAPADTPTLPETCPSCGSDLVWRGDFLRCPNRARCRDQIVQGIRHWFQILGTADWFGIKTVERLVDAGHRSIPEVYRLGPAEYEAMGFGPTQSQNLANATAASLSQPVEDWRFLAAFGIPDLGVGDGRNLLTHFSLDDLLTATADEIEAIRGFGRIKGESIATGLAASRSLIQEMRGLGFELETTPRVEEACSDSPIAGLKVVFTGKMTAGSRDEMIDSARALGAVVQKAVSGATDLLVCGERVGASKMKKAEAAGVRIMPEADYLAWVGDDPGPSTDDS